MVLEGVCMLKLHVIFQGRFLALMMAAALGACAQSQAPMTDAQLGAAVVAARQAQTLRASAPLDVGLPDKLEATMARAALHHAQKTFEHPQAIKHDSMMGSGQAR